MKTQCDVVIAGAGPAGSSAAIQMARAGRRVLLCDRSQFPRDKTCGDGLIADSIAALRTLGLDRTVADASYWTTDLLTISPGGTEVRFKSTFWVLPRKQLDDLLFRAAIDAGAELSQLNIDGPIVEQGRVVGVTGRSAGTDARAEFRAPLTMLATGGAAGVLRKFDDQARGEPSGIAIRAYTRPSTMISELIISLEKDLLPGYAWAFPAPDGLMNVGVGALRGKGIGSD